ncbi:MAG: helix-turn-helix transcriptional regulator [Eubacteriales bacterium]
MKTKNICKFIAEPSAGRLETHRFIYETNISTMKETAVLVYNRILLVKNGEIRFRIDQAQILANKGSLVFAFSNESFNVTAAEGGEYLYIDFSGSRSDAFFRRFGINAGSRLFNGFDGLIPFWQDSLVRTSQENIDLAAEGVLLYTLSRLNSEPSEKSALIQQIIDITEERFNDPELSVSRIARELSYNAKYLSHLFKQKMGMGYTEYLRIYRIKYSIMLIDHGVDSVKNIASLCGFTDPLYFSSVFKQTVGVSPSKYRNKQSV